MTRAGLNNRANQLNPNNSAYWSSRGFTAPSLGIMSSGFEESITILQNVRGTVCMAGLTIPTFVVGYSIIGETHFERPETPPVLTLTAEKPALIVCVRKTPEDSTCWSAFHSAEKKHPDLKWIATSTVDNGGMPGEGPRYCAARLVLDEEDITNVEPFVGLDDLNRLLQANDLREFWPPEAPLPPGVTRDGCGYSMTDEAFKRFLAGLGSKRQEPGP